METMRDGLSAILKRVPPHIAERVREYFEHPPTEEELQAQEAERRRDCIAAYRASAIRRSGLGGDRARNRFETFRFAGTLEEQNLQKTALAAARAFAEGFPNTTKGVAFWGKGERGYGVGKDHLLHAIANEVLTTKRRVYDVRYRFSYDIVRNMRTEWERHTDVDTREEEVLRECDLLLIGDLDDFLELDTGFEGAKIKGAVYALLEHCAGVGKPRLCFTSNMSPQGFDAASLSLGSRLARCVEWFEVRGPDRRRQ